MTIKGSLRQRGQWVRLMSRYYEDEAVEEAGPLAEVLFVRALSFAASSGTDGLVSAREVRRFLSGGLHDVDDLCNQLVKVGLWEVQEEPAGYRIRNWLTYNRAADDISFGRSRDAARKRSERSPDGLRSDSGRSPDGVQEESGKCPGIRTDTDTDTDVSGRTRRGQVRPETARAEPLAEPPAAAPPDLADLRSHILESAQNVRRRSTRRKAQP